MSIPARNADSILQYNLAHWLKDTLGVHLAKTNSALDRKGIFLYIEKKVKEMVHRTSLEMEKCPLVDLCSHS